MTDVRANEPFIMPTNVAPVTSAAELPAAEPAEVVFEVRDAAVDYGAHRAVDGISLDIAANEITAIIGPSGCGKSTFLRSINRLNDLIPHSRHEGDIVVDGFNGALYVVDPGVGLAAALRGALAGGFDYTRIRASALPFRTERFTDEFSAALREVLR